MPNRCNCSDAWECEVHDGPPYPHNGCDEAAALSSGGSDAVRIPVSSDS
jgi:hypothetical protein